MSTEHSAAATPQRTCCCRSWNAHECVQVRYGTASGYDPDDDDYLLSTGEACECHCHDDYRDWCEDDGEVIGCRK